MPALLERTKIRADEGNISTNENWVAGNTAQQIFPLEKLLIEDIYAYAYLPGSSRVMVVRYINNTSEKAQEFLRKLSRFSKLPQNWDNEGAAPPEEKIISTASDFISQMDEFELPLYFVAPGPNGEIYLEYRSGNNTAEIFFNEDENEEMILYKGKEQIYSGEINIDLLINHLR
jgi:hypothetical protein